MSPRRVMDWTCTVTEERLSDFLDGQMSAEESAAFSAHRQSCTACAGLAAQVGAMLNDIHQLEMVEEPEGLARKISAVTLGPKVSKQGWRRWFGWMPAIWQPRFAMGIATVAACCIIVVQAGGVTPKKLSRANLNPADMLRAANRDIHLTYARGVKFVNDLRVVYEIQSRLEAGPQQQPDPERQQHQQPHSSYPQQKSETHPGRSEARGETLFAQGFSRFSSESLTTVALLVASDLTRSSQ